VTGGVTCDASAMVAMLVDGGTAGEWAAGVLSAADALVAPHLAMFEAANILRRHHLAGLITADQAAQAHADLLSLPIDLWPYETLAERAWQLRANLSIYDAAYVAVAELTDTALVTLDARIATAPGLGCVVKIPEVRTRDGQLEIEPMSNEIRLEKRGRGLVAVSDTPVPPLDAEGVRSVVERLRR